MGIIPTHEALSKANYENLDLVQINFKDLPICKLMDYGKYKYAQQKEQAKQRKQQPKNATKEVRLTPRIEQHDIEVKIKRTKEFLDDGFSVRVSMLFKGRENNYKSQGLKIIEMFKLEGYNYTDIKQEGNILAMILTRVNS